jgi:hypothetical protein
MCRLRVLEERITHNIVARKGAKQLSSKENFILYFSLLLSCFAPLRDILFDL